MTTQYKTIASVICTLIVHCLSAQFASDSLIRKYRVKQIKEYSYYNTPKKPSSERIWKYDTLGRLYFNKLIDNDASEDRDTSFSGTYYFYKGNKLVEDWVIGVWNLRTMKQDTTIDKYSYDSNDSLIEIEVSTTWLDFGLKVAKNYRYEYGNGRKIRMTVTDANYNHIFEIDSFKYQKNSATVTKIKPLLDTSIDKHYYNSIGQDSILVEFYRNDIDTIIHGDSSKVVPLYHHDIDETSYKYTYSGTQLLRVEKYKHHTGRGGNYDWEEGTIYFYDNKGLLKETRRLLDKKIMERYSYEFY